MKQVNLSKEQVKDILDDTQARINQFKEKAKELAEAGDCKKEFEYCKAISDLSRQYVRFYEIYINAKSAA